VNHPEGILSRHIFGLLQQVPVIFWINNLASLKFREKAMISAMPELLHRLPKNVVTIFSGRNLLYHTLAIVLTILIVRTGLDWAYYVSTRGATFAQLAVPAIQIGSLLPILGTLAVLIVGEFRKDRRAITTAWALGQAGILGYLISICYKAFTGRIPPPFRGFSMSAQNLNSLVDTSHGFQFGFLKGGVFWGWPSSHTTVSFAMSVCLITLFPKNKILVIPALIYALYVGLGVSVSIHWLSEFVAGAIIGSIIGSVVGKCFKARPSGV
jgi:membrane-associated phospholipid phosphatase